MEIHLHDNPALTVAIALAAGTLGQAAAFHLRLPGIVLLLIFGALLGPDVANLVQPQSLGGGLPVIVGFAVAIILFEGGMSLDLRRLRREERPIRQLITVGALVSMIVGMILAMIFLGWDWRRALLFGTLVIVTGPTVVTPLLRRLRVKKSVSTVLEAEGVLIDAVGAITAAVALEIVVAPSGAGVALAVPTIAGRLLFGTVAGLLGGAFVAVLLRVRRLIPEGLENVVTLGLAVFIFEASNAVMHESGIAAVTVAGLVVGNVRSHASHELREFKEQLTAMLIGLLFVLLVADVRLADVQALGWQGGVVAACSILLIRPLSVAAGTMGTTLTKKERIFIGWIGPRGIVAAAVASLFGFELAHAGIEGGTQLRALVFLVIAVTVVWSAFTGGLAARALDLKLPPGDGWLIMGGNRVALALARELDARDVSVVAVDDDEAHVERYREAEIEVIRADALEESTWHAARLEARVGAIALTANEEVNYVFGEKARLHHKGPRYAIGLTVWEHGITPEMVDDFGGEVLFGRSVDVGVWEGRADNLEQWQLARTGPVLLDLLIGDDPPCLPLVHQPRKGAAEPVTKATRFRRHARLVVMIDPERKDDAHAVLRHAGWDPSDD